MTFDGYVVDANGNHLQSESGDLQIPLDAQNVVIDTQGYVFADGEVIDRVVLTDFEDYEYLKKFQDTYYRPVDGYTETEPTGAIRQGYTEQSNILVVNEMVDLIATTRAYEANQKVIKAADSVIEDNLTDGEDESLKKVYHQTVKKVTSDFESLGFNTAISQMMIFVNAVYKVGKCPKQYAEGLIKMLSCICPHIGEEMWSILGHDTTIAYEPWPTYDEEAIKEDTVEIAVQINGKVKATIEVGVNEESESAIAKANANKYVQAAIAGKTVVKERTY